ncbi:MAG: 4-hydroxythreonine-4-phosphate dehydrogenase PdxA [Candidatus Latescibacteria bacterium]|nr:4-hydroxythreonine-4-phosphate dehydrogenase PdxA [Candidatus Latescibacterota bacterium]
MEQQIPCLMLADDLTGACDAGLQFVRAGYRAQVRLSLQGAPIEPGQVLIWDTETRNSTPEEAVALLGAEVEKIDQFSPVIVYKKVDSTLRGPLGAELKTLLDTGGWPFCLLAPAWPQAGRQTLGGHQLVHGVPIGRSEMARDPGAAVGFSSIVDMLVAAGLKAVSLGLDLLSGTAQELAVDISAQVQGGAQVVILDAVEEADLRQWAEAAALLPEKPLLCGAGGWAAHLTAVFDLGPSAQPVQLAERPGGTALFMGTPQVHNKRQLDLLKGQIDWVEWTWPEGRGKPEQILRQLQQNGTGLIRLAGVTDKQAGDRALGEMAAHVRAWLDQEALGGLIASGGGTALTLFQELSATHLQIIAAVEDSVPICRLGGGPYDGLPLVTKAGALGSERALLEAWKTLSQKDKGPLPLLGITMGDAAGVGPEVIVKALASPLVWGLCRPLVIGHPDFLRREIASLGLDLEVIQIQRPEEGAYQPGTIEVWSPVEVGPIELGKVDPKAGRAAVKWVQGGVDLALDNRIDGLVTAPLNKEAMNRAGFAYAGHTELLGERTGSRDYRMMLASPQLTVIHATTHIALADVPERLTCERVQATISLAHQALLDLGKEQPCIAVAGLNPHAGESGLFGQEDSQVIAPAVQWAQKKGWDVQGPLPGDTLFHRAHQGEFAGVVAMYHDQGHIPVKLVAFADAVNVTLGLPIIRTSVDHGTAFDIAGKGVADHGNMIEAITLAGRLAKARKKKL